MEKRNLFEYLNRYGLITEEQFNEIAPFYKVVKYNKGEMILKEGEICDFLAYINHGFIRLYVNSRDHEESTIHLAQTHEFFTNYASYATGRPSWVNIQAITPCEIYMVNKKDVDAVWAVSHFWESACRKVIEHHLVWLEDRLVANLRLTAEERYIHLMEDAPDIIMNVPLQYIATYLGVKPETLSRIRARI